MLEGGVQRMDLQYSKLIQVGIKWGRYNIFLCKCRHFVVQWLNFHSSRATGFIAGLVVSHSAVNRVVVGLMITYLTTNWKHPHFGIAAVVTNVHDGASAILVIVLAHISDRSTGHFKMIMYTNIAYFLGLGLLSVSAGFMSKDITAKVFYGAAVLIAFGEAGRSASLEEFLEYQCKSEQKIKQCTSGDEKTQLARSPWPLWWSLYSVIPTLLLSRLNWYLIFMISAVAIGFFSFIFWLGRASYFINNKDPTTINKEAERVLRLDYPENLSTLGPVEQLQEPRRELYTVVEVIPYRRAEQVHGGENFRDPEECLRPAERVRGEEFWTLMKLKEGKLFFMKLLPWCPIFLVYSVVEASVNTFYIEQTDNWQVNSNTIILLIVNSRAFSSCISPHLFKFFFPKQCRHIQIGCGLTCCLLSCSTAWLVEIYRMNSVKKGSQIISIVWLLPQFCLAGFMEGLAVEELKDLVLDQVAEDNKLLTRYVPHIIEFILGIGKLITVLILLACIQSWFQGDMKTSHLDKYYRFLAIFSLICYPFAITYLSYFYANGGGGSQGNIVDDEVAGGSANGYIISPGT